MISTDSSSRLSELNQKIFHLESERVDLLRQEVEKAEARVAEIGAFIGNFRKVVSSPSLAAPPIVAAEQSPKNLPKKASKKDGRSLSEAATTDRLNKVQALIKKAGKNGVSAKQLSEQSGIPYSAIRKIISENGQFKQVGENRNSRIFLS